MSAAARKHVRPHDVDSDNYYARLGVPASASAEAIKAAYRELAIHYHPDRNDGSDEATENFKRIEEAHRTLANPELRRAYDEEQADRNDHEPRAEFFHSPGGEAFASMEVDGHYETYPVRSRAFRRRLQHQIWKNHKTVLRGRALDGILDTYEMQALFDGEEHPVHLRVGYLDERVYLDLGDAEWNVVAIDGTGWRIIEEPPLRFVRAAGALPLPVPMPGGGLDELWRFVRAEQEARTLILGWLVSCLHPHGPYPILMINGPHGSAKSTAATILRDLIDPNVSTLRAPPRTTDDLLIGARNSRVQAFDNVSLISVRLSNDLCRLSTGGGASKRTLFRDADETLFADLRRPVLLTSLGEMRLRPDLLDRSFMVELDRVPDDERMAEEDLKRDFYDERPRLVGALLDAVSCALRRKDDIRMNRLPRMADAARWITAAEPSLGLDHGAFLRAYNGSLVEINAAALESSPVAELILDLVPRGTWAGTMRNLLIVLAKKLGESPKPEGWPRNARALSEALRAVLPNLQEVGVEVTFSRLSGGASGGQRTRIVTICRVVRDRPPPSPTTHPPNSPTPKPGDEGGPSLLSPIPRGPPR